MTSDGLLKISELADAAGVPVATVRHYLREGLLPEGTKTSRNMAYYPTGLIGRIRLIKQLQEERFMPLRVIGDLLARHGDDPERLQALVEVEDRVIERALEGQGERTPAAAITERYGIGEEVLERAAQLGLLTPDARGYPPSDVRIIEAIGRFRAGGYDERIGFTVHDAAGFLEPLADLARRERALLERLVGEVEADRAVEMVVAGSEPLEDLVAAIHSKLLAAELERGRGGEP